MNAASASRKSRRAEPINTHVATNGKKSYWFQIDVGVRSKGKRDRRTFTYDTLKQACSECRRISIAVAGGTFVGRVDVTVSQVCDEWLKSRREQHHSLAPRRLSSSGNRVVRRTMG
ncbi:hypothetical protein [Nocardia sp. XZ_19_385]|uniref:hypothetical protein n=1 Tax=Nocardia sp. XZ_19_385 TaxID=2769488 RepID=UPI00188F324A|nr:hypothetical protein [Nocardia sp. XZ_19_385]